VDVLQLLHQDVVVVAVVLVDIEHLIQIHVPERLPFLITQVMELLLAVEEVLELKMIVVHVMQLQDRILPYYILYQRVEATD
tara:strand:- start:77 stop:322 length:246 start_codon:yes stop_codon:yes gene_type:complete